MIGKSEKLLYVSILTGAFLRFYRLGYQSIWGDEALTLQKYASGETISEVLSAIWRNAFHPPFYFIIVHYWYMLGQSEFMLRLPSAVFGIAAIPVMYLLVRRIFGPTAAWLSALVLALSPFHIWYSQEARMYALQMLLVLGSMLFFVRAWQTRKFFDFALYMVFTSLSFYTHMGTIFLVISQSMFVLGAVIRDWRKSIAWIGAQALVLMAFMPWILQFLSVRRTPTGVTAIGFERDASPLHLGYSLYTFGLGYSFGPSVPALHTLSPTDVIQQYLPSIVLPMLVFGVLVVLGLVHGYRTNRMGFWLVLSHLSVPLVLAGAASVMPGVPLNPRYLTVAVVPYWIALALGVEVCMRGRALRLIPAAASLLILMSLYNNYYEPAYVKQDMRSATAFVNERARKDDVIIISSVELGGPFIYYNKRHDVPYIGYPPGVGFVEREKMSQDMAEILRDKSRAWLILGRTWSSDPNGLIPAEFNVRYKLVDRRDYDGVEVSCFLLSQQVNLPAIKGKVDRHNGGSMKKLLTYASNQYRIGDRYSTSCARVKYSERLLQMVQQTTLARQCAKIRDIGRKFMRTTKSLILLAIILVAGTACNVTVTQAAITEPLTAHPTNPHYFMHGSTPVVLLGAGNLFPLNIGGPSFRDSSTFIEYRPYIDQLAAHKINYCRMWLLRPWNSPYEQWAWKRVSGYGTANDGKNKFDLSQWDTTAWTRIKDACAYAASKGIYLEIHLWEECGIESDSQSPSGNHRWSWHPWNPSNNINGLSLPSGSSSTVTGVPAFYNLSNSKLKSLQEAYVSKLIAETSMYPNVIYEICNEYTGPSDWEQHWINFIAARTSRPISVNRLDSVPSYYWSDSRIKMVNFHWGTTSPGTINSKFLSYYSKNKPINYGEPPESATVGARMNRQMLWATLIGSGHIELHTGFTHDEAWDMVYSIRKFMEDTGIRYWEMSPNNSLVTSTPGGSAYCSAKPGSEYLIQIVGSGGGSMKVSLESGKTYEAKVYRSDGTYVNLSVSGNTISGIPSYSYDTIVYIKAVEPPSTTTPNMSLALAVDKTQAVPGDTLTYTLTYKNTGDGDAKNVTITCPVPSSATYVSGGTYNSTARSVNWTISTIAPNGTGTLTFKVKVD